MAHELRFTWQMIGNALGENDNHDHYDIAGSLYDKVLVTAHCSEGRIASSHHLTPSGHVFE
jgi:hypothetical protein